MRTKLVFVTNNTNKLQEIKDIIGDRFEILSLEDINCHDEIPENQDTLIGNALQKARYVYDKYHMYCFADDTGLEVDSLNGDPGVYSARYAGNVKNDQKNIEKLLKELNNHPIRTAQFRTVIALILDDVEHFFEGEVQGEISDEPKGDKGFGYDPVFIPNGFSETFAQIPSEIKNRISHRALAIEKLKYFLRNHD